MSEKEMQQFIEDNMSKIAHSGAYYIQYLQAADIRKAIIENAEEGAPNATTDRAVFYIGNFAYNIDCFNAEAISAFDEALLNIMRNAVDELQAHINRVYQ